MLRPVCILFAGLACFIASASEPRATASTWEAGGAPANAFDDDAFSTNTVWRGGPGEHWTWQVDLGYSMTVGSILQAQGDEDFVFRNAPRNYQWLSSSDGVAWTPIEGAAITNEQRIFRLIPLPKPVALRFARMEIFEVAGRYPALRGVRFFPKPFWSVKPAEHPSSFNPAYAGLPEWIVVVNCTHDPRLPGEGKEFIPLARSVDDDLLAQQVWLDQFNEEFLKIEPRPLCAFISGSFKDWCEVRREDFRGMAEVLKAGRIPIWASCGGAQALAIIAENGVDQEWDCPHCRSPDHPKTPIYTHIGHTATKPCGDYSGCIFERGPHRVKRLQEDSAFAGLEDFTVMESHCGQIAYMPEGWTWLVGPGDGTQTKSQAFRKNGLPIYGAQFHIEMAGAEDSSRIIMQNFLSIARGWGGYRLEP